MLHMTAAKASIDDVLPHLSRMRFLSSHRCLGQDGTLCMQVLIPHKTDVKIESMVASQSHLVVFQRIKGLQV